VLCIWVHGHPQGVGNHQGHGVGTALLEALEAAVRARGAEGIAAWGLALPVWMRARWFRRRGYRPADRLGLSVLLWKPFVDHALPPRFARPGPPPAAIDERGEPVATCLISGWCNATNAACERAFRVSPQHLRRRLRTHRRDLRRIHGRVLHAGAGSGRGRLLHRPPEPAEPCALGRPCTGPRAPRASVAEGPSPRLQARGHGVGQPIGCVLARHSVRGRTLLGSADEDDGHRAVPRDLSCDAARGTGPMAFTRPPSPTRGRRARARDCDARPGWPRCPARASTALSGCAPRR
jgi:hypothetical protein